MEALLFSKLTIVVLIVFTFFICYIFLRFDLSVMPTFYYRNIVNVLKVVCSY